MRGAEDGAEAALLLLRQEELDHPAGAPDVFAGALEIVDATEAVHRQTVAAKQRPCMFEVGLEERERPGSLREHVHVPA